LIGTPQAGSHIFEAPSEGAPAPIHKSISYIICIKLLRAWLQPNLCFTQNNQGPQALQFIPPAQSDFRGNHSTETVLRS